MKKLYILDAAGYLYRSYFAIRNVTNDKGESTNALFGFARSLLKLFKDFHPDNCIAVFDGPNNSKARSQIYSGYKAHRASMPPDLVYQNVWAKEFCTLFGISWLAIADIEADDVIGSIALWAAKEGLEVYICSTDKDLGQIVSDKILMLDTFKDNAILAPDDIEKKFGVPPRLIRDYLALTGDASDNIPGVPGIGPKTAVELLHEFGSLQEIYHHIDAITGKKKQALEAHREDAMMSFQLVTLQDNVEFPREMDFFSVKPLQKEALKAFYASMKFNSLIRELEAVSSASSSQFLATSSECFLVEDENLLQTLLQKLSTSSYVCIEPITTLEHPMLAELIGLGFGLEDKSIWYLPFNGKLKKENISEALRPLFSDPKIGFYGHNIKYHYHVLMNAGIPIAHVAFDTLIASYLLNTHTRKHSLNELILEYFGHVKGPLELLLGKGKLQVALRDVPIEKILLFSSENINHTMRLKSLLDAELKKRGLDSLYYNLELPLLLVLARMEQRGIYLDLDALKRFGKELNGQLLKASQEIFAMVEEEFNLNSPQQISKILFEKLGIKAPKGTSTSAEVLESLKWGYPIAGKIQEYRGLEKLRSTYVDALPSQVNVKTQRIHCTFNQSVAATGRLSCQDPNLQNIPVRSEAGLRIREAFRPQKENWSYIAADYSQIELRLLAHLSCDPILLAAFQEGEDIHRHTASKVFHVPLGEVTKEMRDRAKAVNFGIIYGQGSYGLSQGLGIPQKEAALFIEMYFKQYPKVKDFLESCKDQARLTGKATTLTGRERSIPEIMSNNIQIRHAAERLAVNTPFQGSAADLIKMAMLRIDEDIRKKNYKGYMILQIHDELIFEAPDEEVKLLAPIIKERMEHVIELKVPLAVDISIGKNWKEC